MSEREKELIKRIAETMPSLNVGEQNYILGVAEGFALAKESERQEKSTADSDQPVQ